MCALWRTRLCSQVRCWIYCDNHTKTQISRSILIASVTISHPFTAPYSTKRQPTKQLCDTTWATQGHKFLLLFGLYPSPKWRNSIRCKHFLSLVTKSSCASIFHSIRFLQMCVPRASNSFAAWFLLVLSLPFIAGSFATFIVAERESKAKHLQTVTGVQPSAYWLSTYLWDIINYQIPLWTGESR